MYIFCKAAVLTVVLAGASLAMHPFAYGAWLWPPSPLCPVPGDAQFPLLALVAAVEAGAFGLGMAYAVWGYSTVSFFRARWQRLVMFVGIVWQLSNWMLHDNLHINVGPDLSSMIAIEFAFHLTLIASAALMALALMVQARDSTAYE